MKKIFFDSFETMKKGLYISEFAKKEVKALGLLPPPMLWIFEWDIVSAGNSVLSNLYYISRDKIDQMIAEGYEAVAEAQNMKRSLAAIKAKIAKNHQQFSILMDSTGYQIDLFEVLASYRAFILNYYRWIDTGDRISAQAWRQSLQDFKNRETRHTAKYAANLDFPAFNFSEAQAGARLAQNTISSRNFSVLLVVMISFIVISGFISPRSPYTKGVRMSVAALSLPFRPSLPFDSGRPVHPAGCRYAFN